MSTVEFLGRLRELGVHIRLEDGRPRVVAPRDVLTPPLRAELAQRRDEIVALLARLDAGRPMDTAPLVPRSRPDDGRLPVSSAQQRLWFLHRLDPGGTEYNLAVATRLLGPLDEAALRAALATVTARHEVLRSRLVAVDGVPYQVVDREVPLHVIDLGAEDPGADNLSPVDPGTVDLGTGAEPAERARDLVAGLMSEPFDLAEGPLLRAWLIRLAPAEHVLALVAHHAVADQWSVDLLRAELAEAYRAAAAGEEPRLPHLPVQYADYAAWQRDRLADPAMQPYLAYWRDRLAGLRPLDLPADRPRPAVRDTDGASVAFEVGAATLDRLREIARDRGVTLFMLLHAAFSALLSRYAGQPEVAVGAPVAGRSRVETEPLVGLFVNTLVLRTDLAGDPTFTDLLDRVRQTVLGAFAHAEVPFERLVSELAPERDLSRHPLYQVTFNFQAAAGGEFAAAAGWPGLVTSDFPIPCAAVGVDLSLHLSETGDRLTGRFQYRTALFDEDTVRRCARHLGQLLDSVAADPAGRLSRLAVLAGADRRQLDGWNATATPLPAPLCEQIRQWSRRTPDAAAVIGPDGTLTYHDLVCGVARLAAHLRATGAGPDSAVGVYLPRDTRLVTALLAVAWAGAAYVPLPPTSPPARLAWVLADAGAGTVLTVSALRDRLPPSVTAICLDDPDQAALVTAADPATTPVPVPGAALAYVIHTSGSTGRPKGVAVTRCGLQNIVAALADLVGLAPGESWLAVTTVGFDIAAAELFAPLVRGAAVVLGPDGTDVERAARLAAAHRVRVVQATPSWWRMALDSGWPAAGMRVLCGGERLPADLADRLAAAAGQVWNVYGPTETTIWSTAHRVAAGGEVRIGAPLANTACHVLDGHGRPTPVGVPGELFLGGAGVARGYAGRPELTAERFVADPHAADGSRLYRTGDRARWRADGTLEYLGRADDQVKLRGFRIEPAEIEAALAAHPAVAAAAARVWEPAAGDQRLVGYVVPTEAGGSAAPDDLRGFLAERLPEFMVPALFVALDTLPLTPNGKLDRSALPAPAVDRATAGHVPPATPTERALASIWAELLDVPEVGSDDEFFALGGHSLLATRVIARVRQHLGAEVPLRTLFEHPRLAGFAAALDAAALDAAASDGAALDGAALDGAALGAGLAAPLRPVPRDPVGMPLSYAQQRLWFLHELAPGSAEYNVPTALRLRGQVDVAVLRAALATVVGRHEVLRTRFAAVDGVPVQVVDPAAAPVLDVRDISGDGAARLTAELAAAPFDLSAGPPLRVTLLRLAPDDHVLVLVAHHIAVDHWSMEVLLGDLRAAATTAPLPELPVQYADFAVWQRGWLCGEVLDGQLGYWRDRLAGVSPVELPADRPRPSVRSGRGAVLRFEVPDDVVSGLHELARAHDATMFMVLLAAYQVLLSRLSGQRDIAVGTPVAGRTRVEVERLVGCFVNTLVLRTDLSGKPSFVDLLAQVRRVALDAFTHADVPFERLVEELAPERDRARSPLFQAMINYVVGGGPAGDLLPGVTTEPFPVTPDVARVDLRLIVSESVGCVSGWLEYSTDLFDVGTVRRWAVGFVGLLRGFVADPGVPVAGVGLVDPGERAVLLSGWGVGESLVVSGSVVDRVLAVDPAGVAVCGPLGVVSYEELVDGSGRLAAYLRGVGVGVESVVGVAVPPGPDLVVALLGVWRAGGAFLVIDALDALERVDAVLSAAGVSVVVCVEALLDVVPTRVSQVVVLDDPGDAAAVAASGVVSTGRVPVGALAYVVATSGSSGVPKLVGVSHGALVDYVLGVVDRLGLVGVRCGFAGSVAVDLGLTMVLGGLVGGGGVWLAGREVASDPAVLAAGLVGVGVWKAVPSLVRVLPVDALPPVVVVGGEASELVWAAGLAGTGRVVVNHYGPAEATIGATTWQVPADAAEGGIFGWPSAADLAGPAEVEATTWPVSADLADPVGATTWQVPAEAVAVGGSTPIGRPLPNARCYVLDEAGQLVPVGVVGELWLGGPGVARGYVGRPDLTAERFVADPFAGDGCRLYRTGDRVRWLVGGMLEFLGRVDDQVKVRGFRVEPGEVAAVLRRHPAIGEVVVAGRSDPVGGSRLVGWVVPADPDRSLDPGVVREWVRGRVPEYLVPVVVVVDGLPRLGSGKVDIRSLPDPSITPATSGEAPAGNTEQLLALVWGQLLGRGGVDRGADFFDLGGHSLLAIQVVARLRQALGIEVPVRELFDAPTLAGFAAVVDHHLGSGTDDGFGDRIGGVGRSGPLPVSFAQQRLWFLDQLEPSSSEYNVPTTLRLSGPLEVDALRAALGVVIARHEALRTRFVAVDGEPRQVVDRAGAVDLAVHDVSDRPAAGAEAAARDLAAAAVRLPFDLGTGPLLRAVVIRLGPDDHVLSLVMHHIVSDRWSAGILRAELAETYRATLAGEPPHLKDLPVQYADYAVWQRERLSGAALEAHLAYWREQLAGVRPLELPTDRPRPPVRLVGSGFVPVEVPAEVVEGLRGLGRAHGVTPFMVLLGVWVVLLSRCCGQRDVAVGSPVAGRSRVELEGVVGFFVNTLVLRVDVSGDPSFVEVLGRVRRVVLGAFGHAEVPFERLVEELAPDRDLSRTPLFQVMFDYEEAGGSPLGFAGVTARPFPVGCGSTQYDLTLGLTDTGAGLRGGLEYASALFDAVTVERLAGHFVRLVAGVVAEPGRAVSRVPLLSAAEEAELAGWNATEVPFPPVPMPERIAELARSRPSAPAVRHGADLLSYGELEERVGRLAGRLRAAGVARGDVVGVRLPRGVDVVVAMLAVWRVGAAYLPMDALLPAERVRLLLDDARARLVLTGRELAADAGAVPAVCVDVIEGEVTPLAGPGPSLADAAWVVFTSGSSGWPKGAVVSHRSVAQVWWAWRSVHGDVAGAVWLSVAGESFDVFSADVVRALGAGGCLVVAPVGAAADPAELAALIGVAGVTAVECPPAVLAGLVEYLVVSGRSLPGLRLVVVASELLPAGVLGRASAVLPGVRVGVAFGLTETSVDSTFFDTTGWSGSGMVPVGRPLPNTTCHVLDEAGVPVPVGVPGELFVGGAGVGWGYVGRADLTAERFIADPFAGDGSRVYRTGDRVRWRRGGVLEFLGRLDEQLSVRGYRVEPAEVEAVLAACPGVAAAAVAVREDRLIGYLVPIGGVEVDPAAVRAVVRGRLPGFMVPDLMVVLGRLPVTVTGKVDRRALLAPGGDRAEQASFREPGSATGRRLAELWVGLLGVARVGGVDDFFRLGGHSLLATRLIARVRAQFGVDLPVRVVFETPTLDEFAARVEDLVVEHIAQLPDDVVDRLLAGDGGTEVPR